MGRWPTGLLEPLDVPADRPPSAVLTPKQAARALSTTPQTIYKMIKRGELVEGEDFNWVLGRIKIFRKEFSDRHKIPSDYDFGPP